MPDFHFLRPEWFVALIPLIIAVFIQRRQSKLSGQWKNIVSPALQPYMLKHQGQQSASPVLKYIFVIAALLAIIALSGPSWKKQPSQVFKSQSGLIIALDLSLSMSAQDVQPSRLQRAKYKILDILDQNLGSNIALVAYAGDAHVASPLTRDIKTIQSMLPALDPYIMPAQGSNLKRLVDESIALFEQGKSSPKTLLLVTDGIENQDIEYAANALKAAKINLSILAVGTEQGAPIVQPDGRFFKDSKGQVIMPPLEWDDLSVLASQSNGRIQRLSSGDSDIKYLTDIQNFSQDFEQTEESVVFDQWFDSGYWLILPVLLLSLMGFRKGVVLSICLVFFQPENSWAETKDSSLPDFLLNQDQVAMKLFDSNPTAAAEKFNDKKWKASSLYKANDHEAALSQWQNFSDADSIYNQANALAHLNRLDEAIAAYDEVLKKNPDHEDALFNKQLIEQLKQQQDNQQQSDGDQSDQSDSQQDSEQKDSQQKDSKQGESDQDGKQSDDAQQQDSQQASEADQNQPSDNPANQSEQEQKDAEQQAAKQQDSDNPEQEEQDAQQQASQSQSEQKGQDQERLTPQQITKNAEQEQAMKQWMERIPDDPGGLLRNKFLYQYKNRNNQEQNGERKPW